MKMIMMSSQNNLQKSVNRWQLRIGVAKNLENCWGYIPSNCAIEYPLDNI
ncbi:MAG: hypothetical protein ACLR8F_00015 [Clostridia bacterium]